MKKIKINHPRLYAFSENKVINLMMLITIVALLMSGCTNNFLVPFATALVSILLVIGYSVWFWIKKPQQAVINTWISDVNGYFTLYFLIVVATKTTNELWYVIPAMIGVCAIFVSLIKNRDEIFDISTKEILPMQTA